MSRLTIRIDLDTGVSIGPGKIAVLEAIDAEGSIAAAARRLSMSYARAWRLVVAIDADFARPVVRRGPGGPSGGGAALTDFGRELVRRYRRIEASATAATEPDTAALTRALGGAAGTALAGAASTADEAGKLRARRPIIRKSG